MTWELEYQSVRKTLAEWGISGLNRILVNQAPDIVTFVTPGVDFDADPAFSAGQSLTIYRDGVQWFVGRVVSVPVSASARDESHAYRVEGPWWYFDHLVFEQVWYLATNPTSPSSSTAGGLKSRVVLNQGFNGAALTTGAQIAEAVAWAITAGAPIQATTSTTSTSSNGRVVYHPDGVHWPDVEVPTAEAQDVTVAEVIRKELRWHPDAVTWFDYSTTPPTFHVATRGDLDDVSVAITECDQVSITPRTDLQVSAVCLRFEQQEQADAISWLKVTKQIAPPEAIDTDGDLKAAYRFGALIATIDLMGAATVNEYASVTTTTIAAQSASPAARLAWWRSKIPWLSDASIGDLTIGVASRTSALPKELVDGAVMPWMAETSEPDTITAEISYRVRDAATDVTLGEKVAGEKISISLTATDAATGTYRRNAVSDGGEAIPQGLATQIFAAAGALQYEGSVSVSAEEIAVDARVGNVLNVTGGRSAWATMVALVQSVEEDVDAGRTVIQFGPAQHLGPNDLVELLRVNRLRVIRTRLDTRDTGKGGAAHKLQPPENYPKSESSAGSRKLTAVGMRHPTTTSRTVKMDSEEVRFDDQVGGQYYSAILNRLYLQISRPGGSFSVMNGAAAIPYGAQLIGPNGQFLLDTGLIQGGGDTYMKPRILNIPVHDANGQLTGFDEVCVLSTSPLRKNT